MNERKRRRTLDGWRVQAAAGLSTMLGSEMTPDMIAYFHPLTLGDDPFGDGRAPSGSSGLLVYFFGGTGRESAITEVFGGEDTEVFRVPMAQPDDELVLLPVGECEELPNGTSMLVD